MAQVAGEEGMVEVDVALETDRLEALAHAAGNRELLDLLAQRIASGFVRGPRLVRGQAPVQAVAEQERGLAAVAGEVEPGAGTGLGQGGEIHRGGEVLQ